MKKFIRICFGFVLLFSLLATVPASAESGRDSEFFAETGHNVQGEFWHYYQTLANPNAVLGYPITEQFKNKDDVLVQYFQRGRLEMVGGQVKPSALGALTYSPGGVQLDFNKSMACEFFAQTGYSVCIAFLDFFNANGGVDFFGYPISSFEFEGDAIVQYFQNGCMEWRASNPEGNRVVMTHLGTSYFTTAKEDPALLDVVTPVDNTIESEVISLDARAFPWKSVTYSTDSQLVFVVVQNQILQPVRGATGTAKVTWTDGSEVILDILTGDSGISTLALPVNNQAYGGLVTVEVNVQQGDLTGHTTTSFRIWY